MLKEIAFSNFKGQTGAQPLNGMDIFIGRNGSGKTTRIQSIGLSMLGYIPKQGRTAADTFKYATGENMTVGLKTDDFAFTRTFSRDEKHNKKTGEITVSIKESVNVSPGKGERNDTAKKARVAAEIGSFPVMLDFSEFLSLSDAKRRDFVYSLSPITSDSWDRERIHRYLVDKLLTDELQVNNDEQYEIMQTLVAEAITQFPVGFGVSEGLQAMLDWVEREKKFWGGKQKDAQGAVRQFADMKNELAETDRNIAALKTELEDLQKQLIQAEKRISTDQERQKSLNKRNARITELAQSVDSMEANPVTNDTESIDIQIAEHQAQVQEAPDTEKQMAALNQEVADSKVVRTQHEQEERTLLNDISYIQGTVKSLENAVKETGEASGSCVIHKMIKCERDFSKFGDWVEKKKAEAKTAVDGLSAKVTVLRKKIKSCEATEEEARKKQSVLIRQVQDINNRNAFINKSITELTKQKNDRMAAAVEYINKLKLYRDELSKLKAEVVEPVTGLDLLEMQVKGIQSRMDTVKKSVADKEEAKQTIINMQKAVLENRAAGYKADCLKLIFEALGAKGIQGELVKEILEPIRAEIGGNLKLMGFNHEPFFQTESDTGKEIFQFGWVNEKGHSVNFDALSTGQQTVFLVAMMLTIIDRAQPKLRVLVMDDLNHLDRNNFQMLINGLGKVKDKLDNIILAGAIEFDFAADGWNVYDLSAEPEEVKRSA